MPDCSIVLANPSALLPDPGQMDNPLAWVYAHGLEPFAHRGWLCVAVRLDDHFPAGTTEQVLSAVEEWTSHSS